ncbi:hypothetical protein [Branchiibius sp. NY16-3462-2]|uniref:hypothetical protein n=1 Tax=Branchiibius sp. NY16-3462-2 TaxID=1807500 RepID=UPI00079529B0|nr:hypothetical protein [Branchiibius sp. NY16-3462-2]KYH44446.1 hypothetical protein AZH51_07970 [Branchiibius sp. NY16-3462-2]
MALTTRTFTTAPQRLFRAFTDPVELAAWWPAAKAAPAETVRSEPGSLLELVDADGQHTVLTFAPAAAGCQLTVERADDAPAWAADLDKLDALVDPPR